MIHATEKIIKHAKILIFKQQMSGFTDRDAFLF